jgi:hypothetical protein
MSFSVFAHKPTTLPDREYTWGMDRWDDDSKIIQAVRYCWCPVVFAKPHRRKDNFLFADWIALDFDSGPSLAEITKAFATTKCVIGTTKSHQKPKSGNPPCDRFRAVIKLKDRCENMLDYEHTLRVLSKRYDADKKAVDAARYFRPCNVTFSSVGNKFEIIKYLKVEQYIGERKRFFLADSARDLEVLAHNIILNPKKYDGRNNATYIAAARLKESGKREVEAIEFIARRTDLPKEEIIMTVRSVWKRT